MNATDTIVNAALLGTAAKEFVPNDGELPAFLQEAFARLRSETAGADPEEVLYRMGALVFACQRAGTEPEAADESLSAIEPAAEEEEGTTYFSRDFGQMLEHLCANKHYGLLEYAYRRAMEWGGKRLIPPAYLPDLFRKAYADDYTMYQNFQRMLWTLAGRRGVWLRKQMGYDAENEGEEEEMWKTASLKVRKHMLYRLRKTQPDKALALLQSDWKEQTVEHREHLVTCLGTGLSVADEPFLQMVAEKDRSDSVRKAAQKLLLSLPDSQLIRESADLLRGKLRYQEKTGWEYEPLEYTPQLKTLGLQYHATVLRNASILQQLAEHQLPILHCELIERMPLDFWAELLDRSPEEAAELLFRKPPLDLFNNTDFLEQNKEFEKAPNLMGRNRFSIENNQVSVTIHTDEDYAFIGIATSEYTRESYEVKTHFSPIKAIFRFNDARWARYIIQANLKKKLTSQLIQFMTPEELEEFDCRDIHMGILLSDLADDQPWGPKLSTRIVEQLIKQKKDFNTDKIDIMAPRIHRSIIPLLNRTLANKQTSQQIAESCRKLKEGLELRDEIDRLVALP